MGATSVAVGRAVQHNMQGNVSQNHNPLSQTLGLSFYEE
jgi:hypothetical protein